MNGRSVDGLRQFRAEIHYDPPEYKTLAGFDMEKPDDGEEVVCYKQRFKSKGKSI